MPGRRRTSTASPCCRAPPVTGRAPRRAWRPDRRASRCIVAVLRAAGTIAVSVLMQRDGALGHDSAATAPRRPRRVELLEGDAARGHARRVVDGRDRAPGGNRSSPPVDRDEPFARLRARAGPVVVRLDGQRDVGRGVIAAAQDPRRVVRRAARRARARTSRAQHDRDAAARQLPGRRAAEPAEPDDGDALDVSAASVPSSPSRGSSQRRMSRLASSIGREPALRVGPRRHAALHRLADRPVLPVDQVPEVGRVGGVERRPARPRRARTAGRRRSASGPGQRGQSVNAATWSADRLSIRLG